MYRQELSQEAGQCVRVQYQEAGQGVQASTHKLSSRDEIIDATFPLAAFVSRLPSLHNLAPDPPPSRRKKYILAS